MGSVSKATDYEFLARSSIPGNFHLLSLDPTEPGKSGLSVISFVSEDEQTSLTFSWK
jgi:hypothetical protein